MNLHETGNRHKVIAAAVQLLPMWPPPIEGIDNAIVVHEPPLTLPLGIVRAFDPKHGWAMQANAYGQ